MNFNERHYYVCPVCGRDFSSVESYPSCDFCNNHEVLVIQAENGKKSESKLVKCPHWNFRKI